MNQVLENIQARRSVREYLDKQIPKDILEQVITAGLYAPSAMNTQNWQFTVVQGEERLAKLQKAIAGALQNPDYHRFYQAPVLVMVSAPRDYKHGMADCAAALENIFLAAYSLGIGSVWINQLLDTSDNPAVRGVLKEFGVPDDHTVRGCAALGYAADDAVRGRENKGKVVYA